MPTRVPNFNFLALLVFEIKRVSPNLTSGLPAPSVCSKYLARSNSAPTSSIVSIYMHRAVMRICISHRLSIICAQKWVLGGFEGEGVKILSSNPQKALPCVNTRLLMYRVTKSVQRPELVTLARDLIPPKWWVLNWRQRFWFKIHLAVRTQHV